MVRGDTLGRDVAFAVMGMLDPETAARYGTSVRHVFGKATWHDVMRADSEALNDDRAFFDVLLRRIFAQSVVPFPGYERFAAPMPQPEPSAASAPVSAPPPPPASAPQSTPDVPLAQPTTQMFTLEQVQAIVNEAIRNDRETRAPAKKKPLSKALQEKLEPKVAASQ